MTMLTGNLISVEALINDAAMAEFVSKTVKEYIDDNDLIPTASDVANEFDASDIADHIDVSDIAEYINVSDVCQDIADNLSMDSIARCLSISDIIDEIDYERLAEAIQSNSGSRTSRRINGAMEPGLDDKVFERLDKLEAFVESIGSIIDNYRKKV